MSGAPREPGWWYAPPGMAAAALSPLGALYGAITARRMAEAPRYRSLVPVICVGNFTAGGAGKTPCAIVIVRRLKARGYNCAVLSRGYGGRLKGPVRVDAASHTAQDVGDEPLLLARHTTVFVSADRAAGARAIDAAGEFGAIVMDDGLQNPALAKDLTIAVVDGTRGLGNGRVMPAGPLRAPLAAQVPKVDCVFVNGAAGCAKISDMLAAWPALPVIAADLRPDGATDWLRGARIVAFAGIGSPDRFFSTVRACGAEVVAAISFPDHHAYTTADERLLVERAKTLGATLITTEKDFARTPQLALNADVRTLPVVYQFAAADSAALDRLLDRVCTPLPSADGRD